jgi:hypothetical protein
MWAIQLCDGERRIVYLREYLLEGRILIFDKEEAALRFMQRLARHMSEALGVRLKTIRYLNDPKKEKPCRVNDSSVDRYVRTVLEMG